MGKQFKAVLFDLDGTLLDTIGDIHHNVNLAMKEFGYPTHTKDGVRSFVNRGALDLMTKSLPEYARDKENVEKVLTRYLEIYDKYVSVETVPYDGICNLIEQLKKDGVRLAIVSNKPERHVKFLAEKFFGEGTFSYISGTGGDKPVKPKKECVDLALSVLGVKHEDALFVGDSNVDMDTAKNAGLVSAGVTWGFHGKESFQNSIPDNYIDTAEQLYNLISGNCPDSLEYIFKEARKASESLALLSSTEKNALLSEIAKTLTSDSDEILCANDKDIENAKNAGLSSAMIERLTLTQARIDGICTGIKKVIALDDPIGKGTVSVRPNGLEIKKVCVPLGVVGIIYESRPNVTCDAAVLCLKSGNACILRGGKEAINSNIALMASIRKALTSFGLSPYCVTVIEDTTRESSKALMTANGKIDVLIPRGGKGLIDSVVNNATVPVIETGAGNCHVYVDSSADIGMASEIIFNARAQRPSVCNSAENLLVAKDIAKDFLPVMAEKMKEKNVELRGCEKTLEILPDITKATTEDFYTEYNDYILAVKVVENVDEVIKHINAHSTHHSEAIVTKDMENAKKFCDCIDSAAVYVNASTRFTDGEEFGLGAEIGISTQKLHARGPMGLEALTTTKYVVTGNGQIRQ